MVTITTTDARSNLFNIVKKTAKGHVPTKISSKDGNVVMISENDYESLLETAELLSISGLKESISKSDKEIEKGEVYNFEEIFKD
ncbi:prevent-host-death protein [Candidatus Peregrinibacteria bacterium CG10_big_fil_rev_8_21_14_0_10_36_19]|nr:MAG: prevent-host-death protein [Candidatus Peregrinibacteria bacterium CG10_big_fil_rev_8_21_14_0_10_36_19]